MKKYRWLLFFFIVAAAAILIYAPFLWAVAKPKNYPERSVEVVVGYGAGGGSDLFVRAVVLEARKIMKVPLVVVNKPGAGGVVALEYIQKQPADGYSIWVRSSTVIVTGGLLGTTKIQLILPAKAGLSQYLTAGTGSVAVRIPGSSFAQTLASALEFPITATSANITTLPPADSLEAVVRYFDAHIDAIIDCGRTPGMLPSTVVNTTGEKPVIVRHGVIQKRSSVRFRDN